MPAQSNTKQAEIVVENVTMRFRRVKDEASSLKELLVRKLRGEHRYEMFTALDNISFCVEKGEVDLSGNIDSIAYSSVKQAGRQNENFFAKLLT